MREKEGIDWDRTWQWIAKGDLKGCTEALICSAQEQALRTNYTRFHIDHTAESSLCRICGSKGETVAHVVSECGKLAQTEYEGRHDTVIGKLRQEDQTLSLFIRRRERLS